MFAFNVKVKKQKNVLNTIKCFFLLAQVLKYHCLTFVLAVKSFYF